MPCYDPPPTEEELEYYARCQRERQEAAGRYDLTATRDQLAQWLCDALRGNPAHPDMLRWWEAHKKFHDKLTGDYSVKYPTVKL